MGGAETIREWYVVVSTWFWWWVGNPEGAPPPPHLLIVSWLKITLKGVDGYGAEGRNDPNRYPYPPPPSHEGGGGGQKDAWGEGG